MGRGRPAGRGNGREELARPADRRSGQDGHESGERESRRLPDPGAAIIQVRRLNAGSRMQVTYEAFEAEARAQGFDEIVERKWDPGTVVQSHTHPFAVRALVVRGEMWLS